MKVNIKRLDETAILPTYGSEEAAGFDFYALSDIVVPAGQSRVVSTGVAMSIPKGYEVQIRPRSGLSAKTQLRISNAPGTLDSDFTGEIKILVDNISRGIDDFIIKKGQRVAQGVLAPVVKAAFQLVHELEETERGEGGLGSTGE